jgi:hypothetical protein
MNFMKKNDNNERENLNLKLIKDNRKTDNINNLNYKSTHNLSFNTNINANLNLNLNLNNIK